MVSVKKYFIMYIAFLAKSRKILLVTLAVSLLLNLVLFLRIPVNTKPDIVHTYSEETIAQLFADNLERDDVVPRHQEPDIVQRQSRTDAPYDNKRVKHLSKSLRV
jgi:hypothetical protein